MKPFLNRILICVIPVVLSVVVVAWATIRYLEGLGGFKLGVDLVGGTILIYEIDATKFVNQTIPTGTAQQLAEKLKKRLDPADTFGITVRAASDSRVEIVLPTGGEHQVKEEQRVWKEVLAEAQSAYHVERYTVRYDEFGRNTKLVGQINAQHRDLKVEDIRDFVEKNAPRAAADKENWDKFLEDVNKKYPPKKDEHYTVRFDESDRNGALANQVLKSADVEDLKIEDIRQYVDKNAPNPRAKWDDFLDDVAKDKTYGPRTYTASRGNTDELLAQILQQQGSQIDQQQQEGGVDARQKLVDFIEAQKKKVQQQSLTTEGVQDVKEKISHVGSLQFLIIANDKKDKDGMAAARKFMEKANHRDDKTHEYTNKVLHDDLENAALQGLPPSPLKKEGNKLYCLGEKFDTSENYSYSWVELSKAFRAEHGLNDPRYDKSDVPSSTDKDQGELIGITQKDVDRFYSEKLNEKTKAELEEQFAKEPKLLEKLLLLKGETVRGKTRINDIRFGNIWINAAQARYKGETFLLDQGYICFSREAKSVRASSKDREKEYEYFLLMRDPAPVVNEPEVTGEYLDNASAQGDEVHFSFRSIGADLFYDFTRNNIGQPMAIILDGYLHSWANIQSAISSQGRITFGKNASQMEINRTVQNLNAGALPATLQSEAVSENTMGPTLGNDTIFWGSVSIIVAFVAVLLFMILYYRFAGMVACIALFANLSLTIAFMVLVKATFTLPGLAGLVLMLGMAVDANVLIYERLREERDRGASIALAIRNGYDRAFPTIIDTHLSSIFTAVVLYIVGNDQLKGFGISLTVGLIISLFTSLYMTRLLFDFWLAKGWLHKLSMFRFLTKTNIDFMAIRYYWFTATILLTVIGGAIFIFRLDKGGLNIDFVGGTAYTAELVKPLEIDKLRDLFAESRQDKLLKVENMVAKDEKDGKASKFEITYAKDGEFYKDSDTVSVELPDPVPTTQFRARAGRLEDVSVEQIYVGTAEGHGSAYFTLRTAEKSPDLVQVMVNRLMVERDGDKSEALLKKILLKKFDVDDNTGKLAQLTFTNPKGEPEFASKAQVTRLLKRQIDFKYVQPLKQEVAELKAEAKNQKDPSTREAKDLQAKIKEREDEVNRLELISLDLKGIGPDEGGRFRWMQMDLNGLLTKDDIKDSSAKLGTVLTDVTASFQQRPQPERLENFDSQLAQETQARALYAIIASWAAILLYLWFRFGNWTFGLAAVLCLIHDLFFTLGIIAFCHWLHDIPFFFNVLGIRDFKIDLQTVAALLTLVGYSVSDTIVVFDRIREVRGKNPELTPKMINDSVNQTLSRTLLTATSVWLVVMVLYFLGGEGVHLFAFVMVIGVIVGTYSSIYIASPLLLIFGEGRRPAGVREPVAAPVPTTA